MRGYHCNQCRGIYYRDREKRNGLCDKCGWVRTWEVQQQLHDHSGAYYERWKENFERWRNARDTTQKTLRAKRPKVRS